jgi:hypothetical protein
MLDSTESRGHGSGLRLGARAVHANSMNLEDGEDKLG